MLRHNNNYKHLVKCGAQIMDMNLIDKKSEVAPMLVKLHDSHKLYSLAGEKKPLAQSELSSAMVELLDMQTSPREEELIADVLIGLMRQAEKDLREALSEKLAAMENVPFRLVLHMANDEISVATPVLERSSVLGDLDLIYIIKSKTSEYWQAIAKRKKMSPQVINLLAETRDNATAQNLTRNMNIVLPEKACEVLGDMAKNQELLADSLLHRPDVADDIASSLYQYVGQELKRFIAENFKIDTPDILDKVDDIVLEFAEVKASEFTPSHAMIKTAQRHKQKGLLTINMMLSTLRRGQIQSFIAQFSVYSDTSAALVEEYLSQPKGNGLAVLCRAGDIMKADFVTIYLLTNRMRQKGRMVDVQEMNRAVMVFNKITKEIAQHVMAASKK